MEFVKATPNKPVLIICENGHKQDIHNETCDLKQREVIEIEELSGLQQISQVRILLVVPENKLTTSLLKELIDKGKNELALVIADVNNADQVKFSLQTSGYTDVVVTKNETKSYVCAAKPNYAVGSSIKLSLKKPAPTAWKLDDDDTETIDPDNLLDDDDLKKPLASSLKVCATTGKRKACKDCSCGLAEELSGEGNVVDTTDAPKSSCGSCYLGDAFRCASCPYLGMPAFKPGEKVQLSDNLLKADI